MDWEDIALFDVESKAQNRKREREEKKSQSDPSLTITDKERLRFEKNIVKSPTGCWFWVGAISTPDGYGRFTWQRKNRHRTMLAHRFALASVGFCIEGVVAEHFCNEPLCVRVDAKHVFTSNQSDNLKYAVALGRHQGTKRSALADNDPAARSLRIRKALKDGWDEEKFSRAIGQSSYDQPTLF